jgi:hypothetical protein
MRKSRDWFIFFLVLACALLLGAWLSPAALALPPRPTPAPPPPNASIELHVASAPAGLWTIVQWQDGLGDWHDVEGWQGELDAGDQKVWWVNRADQGKGPFRWVILQGIGGEVVATSESFNLPDSRGEVVIVEVSLEP